jgi:hypothetical protein
MKKLFIHFIILVILCLPFNSRGDCLVDIDIYSKNKQEIHRLLNSPESKVISQKIRDLDKINKSYRFYMSALTFHVFRLIESGNHNLAYEYLSNYSCATDKSIVSLKSMVNYFNKPADGLKLVLEFFRDPGDARRILFEMNEILFREIPPNDRVVPVFLKTYGSFSSVFTDILTKNYAKEPAAREIINYLISKDDIGGEYIFEYVEYIKKNIPDYSRYEPLKNFIDANKDN